MMKHFILRSPIDFVVQGKGIVAVIFMVITLSSCSGYGKIKNIIDFTSKLHSETSEHHIVLDTPKHANEWYDGVNWVNTQPDNFQANALLTKFIKVKSYQNIIAPPVMGDGRIFILSDNAVLSAFDANSYKTLWTHALNTMSESKSFGGGGILLRDGRIYVTHETRDIVALEAATGRELWRRAAPDLSKAQPVLYNNLLLVLTVSNQLCAMRADTGQIIWQHDGLPEVLSYGRGVAPIVHNDRVFVCYSSGELAILDVSNGQELWQMNLARDNDGSPGFSTLGPESQPILDGDNVYIASGSNVLMKLNIMTGQVDWKRKLDDIQSMNKSGNTLFIATNGKQVAALSAATGLVAWATDFSVDGSKLKKLPKPVQFLTPVIIDGSLIIISADGKIRVMSPMTGFVERVIDVTRGAAFLTISEGLMIFTKTGVLSHF